MKEYRERELKWLSVVSKMDVGTAEKDSKLKKLVRTGIPASIRARSWQFLSRSREYQKRGVYQASCNMEILGVKVFCHLHYTSSVTLTRC
jgi:hypothetical protein